MAPVKKPRNRSIYLLLTGMLMLVACDFTLGDQTAHEAFADTQAGELAAAALDDDFDRVDALLQSGVNINATDTAGRTPLNWVLAANNLEAAEYLLKKGANPNHPMNNKQTAVSLAAVKDQLGALKLLLKYKGDPNAMGANGDPPLVIAVLNQRDNTMRLLLKHGANVNYASKFGDTAADTASAVGRFDIVAYLLEQGFNTNIQRVAAGVEIRVVPKASEAYQWKLKVIEMLKERGAVFPAMKRWREINK